MAEDPWRKALTRKLKTEESEGSRRIGPAYCTWQDREEWRPREWDHSWEYCWRYRRHRRPASTSRSCQACLAPEPMVSRFAYRKNQTQNKYPNLENQTRKSNIQTQKMKTEKQKKKSNRITGACCSSSSSSLVVPDSNKPSIKDNNTFLSLSHNVESVGVVGSMIVDLSLDLLWIGWACCCCEPNWLGFSGFVCLFDSMSQVG